MRTAQLRYLLVATALLALGCDPAYRLAPVAWVQEPELRWSRAFDGFSLRTRFLGGLIGEWWLRSTFEVFGNSERVTLTAATLKTARERYAGVINARTAIAAPGGGILSVDWDFGRDHPAPEILGEGADIILEVNVGSRAQIVRVEYKRTACC
jgi:hypothetical protein